MKRLLLILFIFAALILGVHFYNKEKNTAIAFSYLKKFEFIPVTNSYAIAAPQHFFGHTKAPRAVLLLHGYGTSPASFGHLTQALQQKGIPYFAPLIMGFGLGDFHLAEAVVASDWIRETIFSYDLLADFAEKVDVIGISNGGALECILANNRPVDRLILVSPNLFVSKRDRLLKQLLTTPVVKNVLSFLLPVGTQPKRANRVTNDDILDPKVAWNQFRYKAVPATSVTALWEVQDLAVKEISALKHTKNYFLYGKEDEMVDIPAAIRYLQEQQIPVAITGFSPSGHDLFEDYERRAVVDEVMNILQ